MFWTYEMLMFPEANMEFFGIIYNISSQIWFEAFLKNI